MPAEPPRKLLRRIEDPRSSRFVTFSCYQSQPLFECDQRKDRFVLRLKLARDVLPIELYEWVVMPTHVHLLLRCTSTAVPMPKILSRIKSKFARDELAELRREGRVLRAFWTPGGGYDRNIYSNQEFEEKREYMIANPVAAGLVKRATDWRWSSVGWKEHFWDHPEIGKNHGLRADLGESHESATGRATRA